MLTMFLLWGNFKHVCVCVCVVVVVVIVNDYYDYYGIIICRHTKMVQRMGRGFLGRKRAERRRKQVAGMSPQARLIERLFSKCKIANELHSHAWTTAKLRSVDQMAVGTMAGLIPFFSRPRVDKR